jgi:DNA-binding response OmpR family regulator
MSKVLVVEDVADSAALAKKILTKYNHEVIVAVNGEETLQHAILGGLDMIIMDLGLPDVDGQTLLGILRRKFGMENTPIIVCTAWPPDSAKRMAQAYGFDDYICKPYQVLEFMDVVDRVFEKFGSPDPSSDRYTE